MKRVQRQAARADANAAAIYCRVSTAEQGRHGYSLGAQVQDCRALADEIGVQVVAEFTDIDTGAELDLPGLNAALDAAERGRFSMLLVYDPDRLARGMGKQIVLEEQFESYGVSIRYFNLRIGDSAEDRLLKNVRVSIAEYEREKIKLRTSRGRRAKAERGLVVGIGLPPFGYRYVRDANDRVCGLAPDPATAPIVQRIFRDVAEYPLLTVCKRLNAEGIPTYLSSRTGWTNSTLLGILENPVYLGQAAYGRRIGKARWRPESEWLRASVPPIVTPDEHQAAKDALRRRKSVRGPHDKTAPDPYLLRSILTCGHCGGALACTPNNGYRYYVCLRSHPNRAERLRKAGCSLAALPAIAVEDHLWQIVRDTLMNPEHLADGLAEAQAQRERASERQRLQVGVLDREIAKLRGRLSRIIEERLDVDKGSETDLALKQKATEVEETVQRLLAERASLEARPSAGLGSAEVQAIKDFASRVRVGLERALPAERRRVYELLKLRGTVRLDHENGVRFGRRHAFTIDWEGEIPIQDVGNDHKKIRLLYFTHHIAEWESQYLRADVADPVSAQVATL